MSDLQAQPVVGAVPQGPGLSQLQRVVNVFSAPSKTFIDIRDHSRSWWLPFLLFIVVGTALFATVSVKVGWDQVVQNSLRLSPKQAEQLDKLTPEQRATQMKIAPVIQQVIWGAAPIWVLLLNLIGAGILLGTINFAFGGRANYSKVLAVTWYAGLPGLIKLLLGIVGLWVGMAPESFLPQNPAGTNLGYFFAPPDVPIVMWALLVAVDATAIWTMVLMAQGLAKVAGTKPSSGYIAVFGWWTVGILANLGITAAMS
jgi:hypothetical protein